jgi:hypothetical protein
MRWRIATLAAVVLLGSTSATRADPPASQVVVEPVLHSNLTTLGVNGGPVLAGTVVGPSARVGLDTPGFFFGGELAWSSFVGFGSGSASSNAITASALFSPYLWRPAGVPARGYVTLGLDAGPSFYAFGGSTDVYPTFGGSLGIGVDYAFCDGLKGDASLAAQTQATPESGTTFITEGIGLSLGVKWAVGSSLCTQEKRQAKAAAPPPRPPLPPLGTPDEVPATCDNTHFCGEIPVCTAPSEETKRVCVPPPVDPPRIYGHEP